MNRQKFMETFFFKKRHNLSLENFDAFAQEDLSKVTERAKELLGVDDSYINEFNPIIVSTPIVATDTVEPVFIYGEDRLRYDLAQFAALFFSKNVLFHYSCIIDHKTSASFNDKIVEIPYLKIKTIETSSRFTNIDKVKHHVFEIKLVLDELDDIIIPFRILLVDSTTPKEEYLISKESLELASKLKSFLRTKLLR